MLALLCEFLGILTVVILTVCILYKCMYAPHHVLQRSGIKVPPGYVPIFGHFFKLKNMLSFEKDCVDKYGPITGYYAGQLTLILVSDTDIVKDMNSKHFESFKFYPPRFKSMAGRLPNGVFLAQDKDWEFRRRLLTPRLSALRVKTMVPQLERSLKTLAEVFGEIADSGKSADFLEIYESYTMETIVANGFGREVALQRGESTVLTKAAGVICTDYCENLLIHLIIALFPQLDSLIALLVRPSWSFSTLYSILLSFVRERKNDKDSHLKYNDLLQLIVNARDDTDHEESADQSDGEPTQLSDDAAVNVAMDLLMAGYETTASTLTFASYLLATNPEIQEKLKTEIADYFKAHPDATLYEAATEIEYIDMVALETLRLFPAGARVLRCCNKSVTIKGTYFPKGAWIVVPVYVMHRDPKIWDDPEKFEPMRFSEMEKTKTSKCFFAPFGVGHHTCLGWRLGLLEVKMTLLQVFRKFTIITAPETEIPPTLQVGVALMCVNGMYLKVKKTN